MATDASRAAGADGSTRRIARVPDGRAGAAETEQLELDLPPPERLTKAARSAPSTAMPGSRLALSPDEAAALLGVSRDYFDEHLLRELRSVRRGRRRLIAVREIERWLESAATRGG